MIPSIVLSDSKMASCCFFMPPIGKQRMIGMSYLLANRLRVDFGQILKIYFFFNFVINLCNSTRVISYLAPVAIMSANINQQTITSSLVVIYSNFSALSSLVFPELPGFIICLQIIVATALGLLLGKSTFFPS